MAKAKKVKAEAARNVLQSRDEVTEAIAEIGRRVRERVRIETAMNDELAGIRGQFEALAQPHSAEIALLTHGVQAWCEAHRAELTNGGKTKTAQLATGEVKWRLPAPSVAIKGADAVLALLLERDLTRFVRTKEEINKEAMLLEPEVATAVPGVSIKQVEQFLIEPFETELAGGGA